MKKRDNIILSEPGERPRERETSAVSFVNVLLFRHFSKSTTVPAGFTYKFCRTAHHRKKNIEIHANGHKRNQGREM